MIGYKYSVGDELYFRSIDGDEQAPVRVVGTQGGEWPYFIEALGDPDFGCECSESELEPLTAVGALKAGSR
jgi:hypothetical protein